MKVAISVVALGLAAAACGASVAPPTTSAPVTSAPAPSPTTSPASPPPPPLLSSTTTSAPPSTPTERTRLQLVDPATLEPLAPPVELPGHVAVDNHVALPDGRLMLPTWEGDSWQKGRIVLFEPATGEITTVDAPFSSGVRVLGYSPALTSVVLMDETGDQDPKLFDPFTMRVRQTGVDLPDDEWYRHLALFDEGRKVALYAAPGFEEAGRPPIVRIADLEAGTAADPIVLGDVVHGLAEVPPEVRRDPESPYGEAHPGLAFDPGRGRLYVAHADGGGLTVVDLFDRSTIFSRLASRPSLWAKALSWLIPPAEAKGNEPSGWLNAFLDATGGRLFVTGVTTDGWRDPETRELHTTTRPLGVTVVDTESLRAEATFDLPVSRGVATAHGIAFTGTSADHTFCDEVCDPGAGAMTERGEWTHSGLYVVDPQTLEVRAHHRPAANFYPEGAHHQWLITESFGDDGDYVDAVDLTTGLLAGRADFGATTYMVTERGVFAVDFLR